MAKLVEYFVSRSIFVNLLTVLLILGGFYTASTMNKEAFPNIDFDIVTVMTIYPGASPEEIEKLVTRPLEDSLKEVDGIDLYRSTSIENRSVITIQLDPDLNKRQLRKAVDDIRSAIDRTEDLPEDSEKPIVTEIGTSRTPIIQFYLGRMRDKAGKYIVSEAELKKQAKILEDRLELIGGVARITRQGYPDTEMHVELDPYKMSRYYVSSEAVVNALKVRNINLPGGKIERKGREIVVRTVGEFDTAREIEQVVVRSNDIGQVIRIKDIARVYEGFKEKETLERADGFPSISLVVIKRESADAIKVVDKAQTVVAQFRKETVKGIKVGYANDFSFFIRRRLGILVNNGISGLALVVLALFVFLGWRTAIMATLGIPVAIGMTFVAMHFYGVTLNLISMFGLILVIGIVVDDAIIVSENIARYVEEGYDAYEAVVRGTREVIAPVMATISTTVAAFGPMLFMTGIFGKFVFFIPLVVIMALISSLLESFFVLPSHVYDINKLLPPVHERETTEPGPIARTIATFKTQMPFGGSFDRFRDEAYVPVLRWMVGRRWVFFTGLNLTLVLSVALFVLLGQGFKLFPAAIDAFFIKVTAEQGLTKEATQKFARAIEYEVTRLRPDSKKLPTTQRELKNFLTRVGIIRLNPNDPFVKRGSQYAMVTVYLTPEQDRERKTEAIIQLLRKRTEWLLNPKALATLRKKEAERAKNKKGKKKKTAPVRRTPHQIPAEFADLKGRLVNLEFAKAQGGPPIGKPVAIRITGKDYGVLKKIGNEYRAVLAKVNGVVDIDDDFQTGKDEIRLKIDERLAAQTGVSVTQVALAVNTAFDGRVATTLKRAEEEVDVRVRFGPAFRTSTDNLNNVFVSNRLGNLIPVSGLARFERSKGVVSLNHYNGKRLLTVTANIDETLTSSGKANAEIKKLAAGIIQKYPGYQVEAGGENEDTQKSLGSLLVAFGIGFLIIVMILCSLFKSLLQPVVVVAAIPFSFIGVLLAFLTHGHPLSFLSLMGIIGLAGVVVNDSIVLVDFANNIRDKNPTLPLDEVVVQAGGLRLRAVILTTVTTVLGLLPTAYGLGGRDPFLIPMALAFAYGLLFATVITLFAVPLLYKTEYQLKAVLKRVLFGRVDERPISGDVRVQLNTEGQVVTK